MLSYLFPIKQAIITFPIAAFVILLPFLLYHYRKYGYVNWFRSIMLYSLLLYAMAAYYLVILPLPETTDTCSLQPPGTKHMQLMPFNFVKDFMRETGLQWSLPMTYIGVWKERAFLQAAFNFLLLFPLGIYLRYYFNRSWLQTLSLSFLVSAFFELTQLSGLYGIYNCPYRLFDVDDLLLNTSGAMAGYVIAPLMTGFLPNTKRLDEGIDLAAKPVAMIRRVLALMIDWIVIGFINGLLAIFGWTDSWWEIGIVIFVYFILFPSRTNGVTIGKWVVRIRVKGAGERVTLKELWIRYGILYFGIVGANVFLLQMATGMSFAWMISVLILLFLGLANLVLAVHVILCLFSKDKTLFYEKLSGTRNQIIPPASQLKKPDPS
ncbi:VanZ family protein [Paenibacillus sp. J2TS4]|uniref:VanZ family protein n=1 Tax=Paenibacillus sp. J2TS4 TaxID=2807194 RepID=UPI001B1FA80E|nr:VanZ family protein [Paenibacillus sp. J2TS4]GIP34878.1 permease [Paenibacillus sp. J2TS4]